MKLRFNFLISFSPTERTQFAFPHRRLAPKTLAVILSTMENNWKFKTLESLQKEVQSALDSDKESYLVNTCHSLRKKQLNDFSIEDLRIIIGQNTDLKYLIPIALEKLDKNILAEGDFYKGDLLNAVLNCDDDFWKDEKDLHRNLLQLFRKNELILKDSDVSWSVKKDWFNRFKEIENINQNVG